jgi:glucose/arabinose dehydrogenase/plastocyanin
MNSRSLATRYFLTLLTLALGMGAILTFVGTASTQAADPVGGGTEPLPPGAAIETVLTGMNQPVAMTMDNQGRIFYNERATGNMRIVVGGVLDPDIVIHFDVDSCSERGLLGIALDPDFNSGNPSTHYIYVYYTAASACGSTQNRVARFLFDEGTLTGSNPTTIFSSPQTAGNHDGGNIHFDARGKLYITIGDNANAANSQNVQVPNGKIHRINPDGSIPTDNPVFTQTGALPSLYAMGLRNSFDFVVDPLTPMYPNGYFRIFASENGPGCDDEMNRIEATYNYGWRSGYPCGDRSPTWNTIAPLWYLPSGQCCEAPVGIEVYTGTQIPQWTGELFMASHNNGVFRHFYLNSDRTLVDTYNTVTGVTSRGDIFTGADGALYYSEGSGYSMNATLKRIVGPGGGATPTNTIVPTVTRTSTAVPPSNTPPPPTFTGTATTVPTNTPVVPSNTPGPTSTGTPPTATHTSTSIPASPTNTPVPPTSTATVCTMPFSDVPPSETFYVYIRCLYCRGIIGGYSDGTFRPNNNITRAQIAKIVSESAGFDEDPGPQIYEDVPSSNTFYAWINRLSMRGHMGGYPCGQRTAEPCVPPGNRPYFRPNESATRGQISKIVSNAAGFNDPVSGIFYTDVQTDNPFYTEIMRLTSRGVMSGYPCGTVPSEPCDAQNRPYFRWGNTVTRGQASKIVVNTFFGSCPPAPPGTQNVDIIAYDYRPRTLTVSAGTTVRWYNYDLDYHTSTSGVCNGNDCTPDGQFDTGNINQYESFAFTFTVPGTYHYYCIPHPYMQADLIVVP